MPQPIRLKDHERDARLVRRRVVVGAVLVVMLTLVLVARAYYLQVIQYDHHTTLAENNRIHVQPIPPTRGLIFDRNGVIIADNRPSFSLTVTRERAGDWQAVLDTLVQVLELTAEDRAIFEKRFRQGRRPFEPVPILFELTEEQIARIAVNQFRLPGVEVTAQLVRHYPLGEHRVVAVRVGIAAGAEHRRTGHKGVGPGAGDLGDVVHLHAAVDLEEDLAAAAGGVGVDLGPRLAQLVESAGDEGLAAVAGVHAHQEHHVELVHHVVHPGEGRGRVEHQAGLAAPGTVLALKPLTIAAENGAVALLTVTPEGGKPMAGTAWAAGRRLKAGDSL